MSSIVIKLLLQSLSVHLIVLDVYKYLNTRGVMGITWVSPVRWRFVVWPFHQMVYSWRCRLGNYHVRPVCVMVVMRYMTPRHQ